MPRFHVQSQDSAIRQGGILTRLLRDTAGNVMPLTAAAMFVLLGLVGGAVDMAGAYKTERRLQAACDAGVLAGRRAVTNKGFDQFAVDQARAYFDNNFDESSQEANKAVFTPVATDDGNTIQATATTQSKTIIMKIFGYQTMDLAVNCRASMGVGNSDITFVLDVTGSMDAAADGKTASPPLKPSKIAALRDSMKSFRTTIANAVQGSNARVRYAFVPYSSTVNVGRLLPAEYIADKTDIWSRRYVNPSSTVSRSWSGSYEGATWTDPVNYDGPYTQTRCNSSRPSDTSWTKDGATYQNTVKINVDPDNGQLIYARGTMQNWTAKKYTCVKSGNNYYVRISNGKRITATSATYEAREEVTAAAGSTFDWLVYQRMNYDTSVFKKFQAVSVPIDSNSDNTRAANVTSTWSGCIQERQTVPSATYTFTSLEQGITPTTALDLDIDKVPTSDPATQWKVMWPEVTYGSDASANFTETGDADPKTAYCVPEAQLLTAMNQTQFDAYADKLVAWGGTYHDIGILWGARLSSTTGIFSANVNAKPTNGGAVSRHMLFMTDGDLTTYMDVNTAYGLEYLDKRVTGDGNSANQWGRHRSRFLAICEAVKARGIRLWVIAFGTTLSDDLKTCGSSKSSFQANSASDLDKYFQDIAKQVGELRITQ